MTNHPNRSKQQQPTHTKGPWQIVDPNGPSIEKGVFKPNGYRPISIANEKGHRVCFVGEHTKDLSRARLIAAAPELLTVLKAAVAVERQREDGRTALWVDDAEAAIAKAEGR